MKKLFLLVNLSSLTRTLNTPPKKTLKQTDTISSAAAYMSLGVDNAWSLSEFKRNLGVRITGGPSAAAGAEAEAAAKASSSAPSPPPAADPDSLTFDVAGIDASLANALRRILLSELPSVAIEHVFVVDNTSVVACEILSHRLGLVPLRVDPAALGAARAQGEPATDANTVVFRLVAECKRSGGRGRGSGNGGGDEGGSEAGVVTGERVLSGALEWLPTGSELPEETGATFSTSQEGRFKEEASGGGASGSGAGAGAAAAAARGDGDGAPLRLGAPRPVHDDILLARLRPGQRIELEAHATVGTGAEHAKWSHVATAWYRLQPELFVAGSSESDESESEKASPSSSSRITAEDADALAEELPGLVSVRGSGASRRAVLAAPARGNERLLEKARRLSGEPRFAGKLALRRAKDHFIFCVESVGALPPGELVVRALRVLEAKCDRLMERI